MPLGDIEPQFAHCLLDRCARALVADDLRLFVTLLCMLRLAPDCAEDPLPAINRSVAMSM